MTKLYLAKSEPEFTKTTDVIVDLDKVLTIRCFYHEGSYDIIMDYTHDDSVIIQFNTLEELMVELRNIITLMGGDASMASNMTVREPANRKHEAAAKLKAFAEMLNR